MKSRMNREVHVRFCERFRGEIPPLPTRLIFSELKKLNAKFIGKVWIVTQSIFSRNV